MNKIGVFIKDTFIKNVTSFGFITMLLSPLILIGIVGVIIYFAANSDSTTQDVNLAVLSEDPSITQILEQSDESLNIITDIETEEEAREELGNETIDGYLVVDWEEKPTDCFYHA